MLIKEILSENIQLDEITRPDLDQARGILYQAGYEPLGKGLYGYVFGKEGSNKVIKLFQIYDTAYISFVKLAMENRNIHFPKFESKLWRVADFYAIRMEKLTPYTGNYDTVDTIDTYTKFVAKKGYSGDEARVYISRMKQLEQFQPGMRQACQLIAKRIPETLIDIHRNNLMMRGDVIVITDPVLPR